jgi:hypothetical protein
VVSHGRGCAHGTMPRKVVQVIQIYKGFSYFVGQYLYWERTTCVAAVPK